MAKTPSKTEVKPQAKKTPGQTLAIQRKNKENHIRTQIGKMKDQIQAALPAKIREMIPPDRMARIAITTLRTSEDLWKCTDISIIAGVILAAQHGLEIDMRGHAWLIPRKTKQGIWEANFQIGYQGLLELARRSGQIYRIEARVVYEDDVFSYCYGTEPAIEHVPSRAADPGPLTATYATALLAHQVSQFEVVEARDVEIIRSRARGSDGKNSPWNQWTEAMWKKTAAIQLCKWLPTSTEMQTLIALDEQENAGVPQQLSELLNLPEATEGPAEAEDELIDSSDLLPALATGDQAGSI